MAGHSRPYELLRLPIGLTVTAVEATKILGDCRHSIKQMTLLIAAVQIPYRGSVHSKIVKGKEYEEKKRTTVDPCYTQKVRAHSH